MNNIAKYTMQKENNYPLRHYTEGDNCLLTKAYHDAVIVITFCEVVPFASVTMS